MRSRTTGTTRSNFVLQDHMFEADNSWSLPAHLSMVSGWTAQLLEARRPDELHSRHSRAPFGATGHGKKLDYPWTDLTWLLHRHHVSWRYYVANGSQPDCADSQMFCRARAAERVDAGIWNPLPRFDTVQQTTSSATSSRSSNFYRGRANGHAPGGHVDHARAGRQRASARARDRRPDLRHAA